MSAPFHTTPIPPLVVRHAQDGAWYWSQLEADRLSPVVSTERLRHYHGLLACHLEGLRLAGTLGWALAVKELKRWKDPEQLFVGWHLAFAEPDPERSALMWSFMEHVPESEAATAAALVWSADPEPWLNLWLHGAGLAASPVAQRVALQVCGQIGRVPDIPLEPLFEASDPRTVAAVCSLAGALRLEGCTERLLHLAARVDTLEGVELIYEPLGEALLACGLPAAALPLLYRAMLWRHARMEADEGGAALREAHRAQVLACLYGHALPPETLPSEKLPVYLLPHILAHHGEISGLPLLSQLLATPYGPIALRAICRITGLEAEDEGLCLPAVLPGTPEYAAAAETEEPDRPGRHLESGLPSPDVPRVRARLSDFSFLPSGIPLARGGEYTPEHCLFLLQNGMLDERFAAAWHAVRLLGCPPVETAAPFTVQDARLVDLQQRLHEGVAA